MNDVLGWNARAVFLAALHERHGCVASPLARGRLDEVIRHRDGCRAAVVILDSESHRVSSRSAFAGEIVAAPLRVNVLNLEAEWLIARIADEADKMLAVSRGGFQSKLAAFVVAESSSDGAVFAQLPFAKLPLDELAGEHVHFADLYRGFAFDFAEKFFRRWFFAGRSLDVGCNLRLPFRLRAQDCLFHRGVNHAILFLLNHHADRVAVRPDDVRAEVLEVADDVWIFAREVARIRAEFPVVPVNLRVNSDAVNLPVR